MKRWRNYLMCIFSAGFFTSCYSPRYVYSPVAHNVPLLTKKGDSKLAGYYSTNLGEKGSLTTVGKLNSGHGLDVQGAYAITNHFAIQADYSNRSEKNYADFNLNNADTSLITYSRTSASFGIGYYTYLTGKKQNVFQVFGGVSFGNSSFTDQYFTTNPGDDRFLKMNVTRLYIQPALMFWYGSAFVSTVSSRISAVYFSKVNTDYSAEELKSYQLADLDKTAEIFWEPAFINSFGLKKLPGLKVELQLGMAFLMSQRFVDYRSLNFSAGLLVDIPKFFEKKAPKQKN